MRACIFPDLTRLTLYSSDKVPSDAFVPVPHCVSVDIESRPATTGVRLSTFIFSHSAIEDVKFIRHCRRMQDFLHVGFRHAIASPAALSTDPGFSYSAQDVSSGLIRRRRDVLTTFCFPTARSQLSILRFSKKGGSYSRKISLTTQVRCTRLRANLRYFCRPNNEGKTYEEYVTSRFREKCVPRTQSRHRE